MGTALFERCYSRVVKSFLISARVTIIRSVWSRVGVTASGEQFFKFSQLAYCGQCVETAVLYARGEEFLNFWQRDSIVIIVLKQGCFRAVICVP